MYAACPLSSGVFRLDFPDITSGNGYCCIALTEEHAAAGKLTAIGEQSIAVLQNMLLDI
jgi:hypothetical protein